MSPENESNPARRPASRLGRAAVQHGMDKGQVGRQISPPGAGGGKVIPYGCRPLGKR